MEGPWLRRLSFRTKLLVIVALTTILALSLSFGAYVFLDIRAARERAVRETASLAEVVGANCTAALSFDDATSAAQTLSSLRRLPDIVTACIFTSSGSVLASYHREGSSLDPMPESRGRDGWHFDGENLILFHTILVEKETLGAVYLKADLSEASRRRWQYSVMTLSFMVLAGIAAIVAAARLQKVISGPIFELAGAARSVSEGRDYSIRVQPQSDDEVGKLSAAFNSMLNGIQERDAALRTAQGALEAKVRDLEHEIRERTAVEKELRRSEDRLLQAQKMEAIGRLAGGVAHDFNNLLTVINGYSELLMRENAGDRVLQEKVEEIHRAGERAAALTRQLLAFGRKQTLLPQRVDLNEIVSGIEGMLRRLIGEDIVLEVRLGPERLSITADPNQLDQVIMNLSVNARDAMPKGGRLLIETKATVLDSSLPEQPEVLPGKYASLTIADSGVGMDPPLLAHIFEPFFTTKDVGKGTGLGLSTVYGIVKQSGGHISVESEHGRGSTFRILFPFSESTHRSVASSGPRPLPKQGSETILLVEDEEPVRRLVRAVLQKAGYVILDAPDGESAITIASRHPGPIDLVLTDLVMPQMNGRELAERVAALRQGIRVLFMSGYSQDVLGHEGQLEEGIPYISKPFKPGVLVARIREILDAA